MQASGNWKVLNQAAEAAEKQAIPDAPLIEIASEKPRQTSMFDTLQKRSEEAKRRKEAAQRLSAADNPNLAPVRHHQTG
jgi:hypothetical protein